MRPVGSLHQPLFQVLVLDRGRLATSVCLGRQLWRFRSCGGSIRERSSSGTRHGKRETTGRRDHRLLRLNCTSRTRETAGDGQRKSQTTLTGGHGCLCRRRSWASSLVVRPRLPPATSSTNQRQWESHARGCTNGRRLREHGRRAGTRGHALHWRTGHRTAYLLLGAPPYPSRASRPWANRRPARTPGTAVPSSPAPTAHRP